MEFHELQSIAESNTLTIQALGRRMAELADSIEQTNQNVNGLIQTISEFSIRSEARINALDAIVERLDSERSTVLRKLNAIESKVDRLLERNNDDDRPQQ